MIIVKSKAQRNKHAERRKIKTFNAALTVDQSVFVTLFMCVVYDEYMKRIRERKFALHKNALVEKRTVENIYQQMKINNNEKKNGKKRLLWLQCIPTQNI